MRRNGLRVKEFFAGLLALALALPLLAQTTQIPVQIQNKPGKQSARKAPSDDYIMVERARRAEAIGDFSRAFGIWKELLLRSPWQPDAIQGTCRALLVTQKYDEAEAFLNDYLIKSDLRSDAVVTPTDPTSRFSLSIMLGQVALARGDEPRAWQIWNAAVSQAGRMPEVMRALVNALLQNRRWEDAERTIRDYRKESKQPSFMAMELAQSLRGQMNWSASAEELVLYAINSPNGWQIAQNYLNQFPDDSAVNRKVDDVLKRAVQREKKNADLWRLLAGFRHRIGDATGFLNGSIVADSLAQGGGNLVLQSSEQLVLEGDIEQARRGFQKILSWQTADDVAARAELGLGRCLEALGQFAQARQAYETFIEKHPTFQEVHEARFRIAEILLHHHRDAAGALPVYQDLWRRGMKISRALVGLRVGDCYAWQDDFSAAIGSWSEVARLDRANPNGEDGPQALLRIARANIWRDSTRLALAALDSVTGGNPVATAFNDAVLYTALLEEGGVYRAQRAFAEADLATFRHQDSLAAVRFDEAANLIKYGKLAEWARFSQAMALRASGAPQTAVAVLDSFVVRYPESVDLDRAKYTRALIRMEDLHDDAGALAEFKEFLIQHPRSIYLEQARKKARILTARVS